MQDLSYQTATHGSMLKTTPKKFVYASLLCWSLFQLWYASPLPFIFDFLILNSTQARALHLAWPLSLVFLIFPLFQTSKSRNLGKRKVSSANVVVGLIALFCGAYLFLFYEQLATRPGLPTNIDIGVSILGIVFLLEAARRVLGSMIVLVAVLFIAYALGGSYMPDVIAHKGASISKAVNHYWLSTEGVFGIALGVSNSLVFMFVLFGALLEQSGAGNYFIRSAFAMMGGFKGGPGKAAVFASALSGMMSGSSTANVVTTGTFTIPLMRQGGFSAEKAGAIEVASSTNGQLMPPVMGAAAFLMAEYVGISYIQVIKHAFLPAMIAYIALGYIVHIEANKLGLEGLKKSNSRSLPLKLMLSLMGFLLMGAVAALTYYGLSWVKTVSGDYTLIVMFILLSLSYFALLFFSCGVDELPNELLIDEMPPVFDTLRAGSYFLLPIFVLMWNLMIEGFSPALSAFWATCFLGFITLTHWPIKGWLRRQRSTEFGFSRGFKDLTNGLVFGARNMISVAIATATAGIIVGTVTLTGVGFVLTELIEVLSGGSLALVLVLTALISLVLGMGLPTTANYIVVSTLMAPVIVQLGAANGLIVPLIAAHLFVFYFGILADDTPPVGLAAYAAAGISGGDPIKTGLQGFGYDIRTAILPFLFLFNTELLLINVDDWWHIALVFIASTIAMLVFCAATQRYLITHNRLWETVALLLISFMIFRPGFVWDRIYPPSVSFPPEMIQELARNAAQGSSIKVKVQGEKFSDGSTYEKVVVLPITSGQDSDDRLLRSGLELRQDEGKLYIDSLGFDSDAQKAGFDFDQEILSIEADAKRAPKQLMYIPCMLLLGLILLAQRRRRTRS